MSDHDRNDSQWWEKQVRAGLERVHLIPDDSGMVAVTSEALMDLLWEAGWRPSND
jgi:hypothetical protein